LGNSGSNGHVRYELKTLYRDSTTHVIFEPADFIARCDDLSGCFRFVTSLASIDGD